MKVKFVPQDVEFDIKPGESVMHVAQDNGLYIKSVCKGVPSCAECRVRVIDGEHNVLPPGSEELSLIGTGHFIDRRRLSCQLKCFGDIVVDMTEQIAKQNGLIGKKTKRAMAKDDRVEQAVAIRSDDAVRGEGMEESPDGPVPAHQQRSEPRENRGPQTGGPGRERSQPRENRVGGGGPRNSGPGGGPSRPQQDRPRPQSPPSQGQPPQGATGAPPPGVPGAEGGEPRKRRRRRGGRGRNGGGGNGGGAPGGAPSGGGGPKPS